jgi:hypothetical protein
MDRKKPCVHVVLAAGPIAKIEHCAKCDVVSVNLGPTTVRLEPGALESLWSTLGEAIGRLRDRTTAAGAEAALPLTSFRGAA